MLYEPFVRKLETVESLTGKEKEAAVALCSDVRIVERRSDIITLGRDPDRVHIILDGWAARYSVLPNGSRRITAFLLPGDFCDIHVTTLSVMDHSILAITDCTVAYVLPGLIDDITRSTPVLTRAFWRSTLIDEAILRQWLVNSGRRDALEAVAHLVCELHARMKLVGLVEDGCLELPVTQEEFGDATGLTAVHVNRTIKSLRDRGLLSIGKGVLQVPDVEALRRFCGFDPRYLHLRKP